jgi:proton glutamate symport protein
MKKSFIALILALTIAAILTMVSYLNILSISGELLMAVRWIAIGGLIALAIQKRSLTTWILISMVIGAEIGNDFPEFAINLRVLSQIFLKLIKTIIAPLLFGTLVVGIAGHSDLKQVGRMGWKSLLYFEIVTTIALFVGLAAINISRAGEGITLPTASGEELPQVPKQSTTDIILHIFPENIAKSIAEGEVLQIVVFSVLFGIALALVNEKHRRPVLRFAEGLSEVMFKFTNIIMYFAPIGVGAAIAYTVGHMGLGIW